MKRMRIVDGECRRLELLEPPTVTFDPDEFVRIKGARTLSPIQRQTLRELFALREKLAEERDVPPFRVMGPKTLVAIAEVRPRGKSELGEVDGFSWKQVRHIGGDVLDAIARAKELGPLRKLPTLPSRDGTGELGEEEYELHERLKAWRRDRARDEGIDSSLVLNRHVLLRLARLRPCTQEELAEVEGLLDWQRETLGEGLLEVVTGFERDLKKGTVVNGRRRRR